MSLHNIYNDDDSSSRTQREASARLHRERVYYKSFADIHPFEVLYWDSKNPTSGYHPSGLRFSNLPCAILTVTYRGVGYAILDHVTNHVYELAELRRLPQELSKQYEMWLADERFRLLADERFRLQVELHRKAAY